MNWNSSNEASILGFLLAVTSNLKCVLNDQDYLWILTLCKLKSILYKKYDFVS